jgi:FMN-dependent NADH-azoreductase
MEHQESYLKVVFGFFGITDVRFVRAEGIAMGDAAKAAAITAARTDIATAVTEAANQDRATLAA